MGEEHPEEVHLDVAAGRGTRDHDIATRAHRLQGVLPRRGPHGVEHVVDPFRQPRAGLQHREGAEGLGGLPAFLGAAGGVDLESGLHPEGDGGLGDTAGASLHEHPLARPGLRGDEEHVVRREPGGRQAGSRLEAEPGGLVDEVALRHEHDVGGAARGALREHGAGRVEQLGAPAGPRVGDQAVDDDLAAVVGDPGDVGGEPKRELLGLGTDPAHGPQVVLVEGGSPDVDPCPAGSGLEVGQFDDLHDVGGLAGDLGGYCSSHGCSWLVSAGLGRVRGCRGEERGAGGQRVSPRPTISFMISLAPP